MTPKAKPMTKQDPVKEAGAPYSLITSLLIGFPFLAIVAAMDLRENTPVGSTTITGIVMLMLGLTLCFYWRRLNSRSAKSFFSFAFIINQWLFMICTTIARIIHPISVTGTAYKSVMIVSLMASSFIALLFVVAWILESPRHLRFQAISMTTACAMLLGIIAFRSFNISESVQGSDLILSAHNAIKDISKNVNVPSEIKELKAKIIAETQLAGPHEPAHEEKAEVVQDTPWSYAGESGPENWGKLAPAFDSCATGTKQSPIDLPRGFSQGKHAKVAYYHEAPLHIVDNGHTMLLSFEPGNQITLGGTAYTLRQIQLHSPSEHTVSGIVYPMELQLIHTDAKNRPAILSVLLEKGASHSELDKIFAFMPAGKKKEESPRGITIDAGKLLPRDRHTFQYSGSLTTPPCTEGVTWNVFKQPIEISEQQIKAFRARYNNNARPVQPLGVRNLTDVAH